jgi:hypothetical protein
MDSEDKENQRTYLKKNAKKFPISENENEHPIQETQLEL